MQALGKLLVASGLLSAALASQQQHPIEEWGGSGDDDTPLPVVIWHGLGDNFAAEGMQEVGALVDELHPGTFVHLVALDDSPNSDRTATFWGNVTEQVAKVCEEITNHPILSTAPAIDALGFSQGGQFLRAYAETCGGGPPVRSLVTFGSQHNGIIEYHACSATDFLCRGAMALLHGQTWSSWIQGRLVPAQYFRDPSDLDNYLAHSNFLAAINNERPESRDEHYAARLARLDHFAMYLFEDDTTVVPKETSWFAEVTSSSNGGDDSKPVVTPLRKRQMYKEDWLGLRRLDAKGGLHFRSTPGEHMELSDDVLREAFADFFGPLDKKQDKAKRPRPIELEL